MKRIVLLLFVLLAACALQAQENISNREEPEFGKFSIKTTPTQFLMGEVPLILEYRPDKVLGNEISGGYVFLNVKHNNRLNMLANGYKVRYHLRFYFNENDWDRTWFLGPQVFYKELWQKSLNYDENSEFMGNKSDRPDEYLYDENRKVYGLELITGFVQRYEHLNIEFFFGAGVRWIKSYRTITYWWQYNKQTVREQDFTKLPRYKNKFATIPSLQIGMSLGFPIHKSHKAKTVSKP